MEVNGEEEISNQDPLPLERSGVVREIGNQAVWSLSSCKPGFGVERLRDNIIDTYWQSDGQLPHLVNVQFHRKTRITAVYLYADYKLDESYTPSRISLRTGSNFNDLQELQNQELFEPTGWTAIHVENGKSRPVRIYMLQIAIVANHQNGRDTHLRQIRIHAPVENSKEKFTSITFKKYDNLR